MFDRIKDALYQVVKSRLFVVLIAFCFLFAILIYRCFYLQIVKGQDYLDNYKLQIKKTREIPGTRGNIYDSNGNLLAYNELAYSVTIEDNINADTIAEKNKILNGILDDIISIVEAHGDSVISSFGIVLDSNNNYQFTQTSQTSKLRFLADVYGYATIDELSDKQRKTSADDLIDYLCSDELNGYGINQKKLEKSYVLKLVNMRYAINLNGFQKYIPTTLASDVSDETVSAIMENMDALDGVNIAEDSLRRYTDSKYFASIIGYTGKISQEEYDALDKKQKKTYDLTDIVGKSGIEKTMDEVLQGTKGEETVYVDSVGKVVETVSSTEAKPGNDVYLSIDKDLQSATYQIIEEKLAGVLLSKLRNEMNYDPSQTSDASHIIIPVDDAYNAFIGNDILDSTHFNSAQAGAVEQQVYAAYSDRLETAIGEIVSYMQDPNGAAYKDLSREMQAYINYIATSVLETDTGILISNSIDTNDATYQAWTNDESISLYTYLNYAISQNWVDTSVLGTDVQGGKYSDSSEAYQGIITYLSEYLHSDSDFDKLLYKYLIKSGGISGAQICAITYEQNILPMDEASYNGLISGDLDAYEWLREKITTLEITPGQLALEPCTGSAVVSDVNSGQVLACVSYPGYDNNRLANTMDSVYYNKLVTGLSRPFYNNATQEKTAPGSTFKMLSSVAGLTEGVMNGSTLFTCAGAFDKVVPSPKCWVSPGAHGSLDVISALEVSCNNFFYEVGYELGTAEDGSYSSDLGIEKLQKYAKEFGLGETSGLEIPESEPQVSDSDSVRSAIGQGTNNYTVSQLNRYVSTVANGGTVYNLSLLNKTTDSNGNVIKTYEPTVYNTMDEVSNETWSLVHQGMAAMVASSSTFSGMNMAMAGKTGTAQQSDVHPDHALFVGYAPADSPEISVAVRIANGYSSSYTAEIGRDIVQYRYQLVDSGQLITGSAAALGTAAAGD